jgi:hypothetical protein
MVHVKIRKYLLPIILSLFLVDSAISQVYVNGYYRSDGTYVKAHYRSSPDGNPYNNYSFPGNVNPYTGKVATGNPETYLRNYYNRNNSSGHLIWVNGYHRNDGTYVKGHYRTKPDGIKSNNLSNISSESSPNKNAVNYTLINASYSTETIYSIQTELRKLGYYTGEIDGIFGEQTLKALNTYKEKEAYVPPNAQLNFYGNGWTCNRGYVRSDNSCSKVEIPPNAQLNFYGNGWTCNRGYIRSGNSCSRVEIPPNAQLNMFGNGWTCNDGYYKSGNSCLRRN